MLYIFLIIAAVVILRIILKKQKKSSSTSTLPISQAAHMPGNTPTHQPQMLQWRDGGAPVSFKGGSFSFIIPHPMVYFSSGDYAAYAEASCIYTKLPVARWTNQSNSPEALGYWPSYIKLSPIQRGIYLNWLSEGKKDSAIQIGYVFVYFYGLERRALIDKKDTLPIIHECVRLLQIYTHDSFINYASHLIAFLVARDLLGQSEVNLLEILDSIPQQQNTTLMMLKLSVAAQKNIPLPAKWALEWAELDLRSPNSVVVARTREQFELLFEKKYQEKFASGLHISVSARQKELAYHPASESIRSALRDGSMIAASIPNILNHEKLVLSLVDIWNQCIEDLKPLSRALSKGNAVFSREAFEKLPDELKGEVDHPDKDAWEKLLQQKAAADKTLLLPVAEMAQIQGLEEKPKLTIAQSINLADTAQYMGLSIVPDAKETKRAYTWNETVTLLRPAIKLSPEEQKHYHAARVMLELGVMMAQADGEIHAEELSHITYFIENEFSLQHESMRLLEAYKEVLIQDPPSLATVAKYLTNVLDPYQREAVLKFLVGVALVNNILDKQEVSLLRKICKNLELDASELDALFEKIQAKDDEPVTVNDDQTGKQGEKIPALEPEKIEPKISLNRNAIHQIIEDSHHAALMIQKAFEEEPDSIPVENILPSYEENTLEGTEDAAASSNPLFANLDSKYHAALEELLSREEWPENEFNTLARRHRLMPSGMLDTINAWSDENLGDFLIEEEDSFKINKHLLEEKV